MLGAVHNPKALVPQDFLLNMDDVVSIRGRIALLANNYRDIIHKQIRMIEPEVDRLIEVKKWDRIDKPDTIGIIGGLPSRLVSDLTLQTENPFKHSKIPNFPGSFTAKTYYRINTKLPWPEMKSDWDFKKQQQLIPDHPLLNTGARNFWNRFRELVDPMNTVSTIPRSMLTRPPLTGRQLHQLLASIKLLNRAVLDAAQIEKVREQVGL
jgi:hypothetical protein